MYNEKSICFRLKLEFQHFHHSTFFSNEKFNQLAIQNASWILWYFYIFKTSTKKSLIYEQVQQHQNSIRIFIIISFINDIFKNTSLKKMFILLKSLIRNSILNEGQLCLDFLIHNRIKINVISSITYCLRRTKYFYSLLHHTLQI